MSSTSQQHGYLLIANYPNLKLKLGAFGHLRSHIQPLQASSGENVRLTVHAWKGYWSCSPLTYLTPTLFVNLLSGDFRPEVHTHTHAAQARVYPELNINTDQVVLLIVKTVLSPPVRWSRGSTLTWFHYSPQRSKLRPMVCCVPRHLVQRQTFRTPRDRHHRPSTLRHKPHIEIDQILPLHTYTLLKTSIVTLALWSMRWQSKNWQKVANIVAINGLRGTSVA